MNTSNYELMRMNERPNMDPFAMARQILRWDPFFGEATPAVRATFAPTFEISESNEAYLVVADVPGLHEDDIDITVTGNQLTVSGERKVERVPGDGNYHVYERQYGKFMRTLNLPTDADLEAITADLDNGVLRLSIGKHEEAKPRKIQLIERIKDKLKS